MANTVGMKVEIDTRGFQGIVSEAKTRSITLKGVRAGIKVLVAPSKAGAPKRSGALKTAQGYKAAKGRRGKTVAFGVQGARTKYQKTYKGKTVKPSLYDHLVQGGTKPHKVGNRHHPGAKPNPYRKQAFSTNKDAIGQAVSKAMGEALQQVIARGR